jgi:hypothetical protein
LHRQGRPDVLRLPVTSKGAELWPLYMKQICDWDFRRRA